MATVEEMARTWKDEKETGGGLKRGEKTEVDGIIGAVIREGERLDVRDAAVPRDVESVFRNRESPAAHRHAELSRALPS